MPKDPRFEIVRKWENKYWEVDESDYEVKKLIKSGKIKFAFIKKWGATKDGTWIKLY